MSSSFSTFVKSSVLFASLWIGGVSTGLSETLIVDLPGLPQQAKPLELVLIQAGSFRMGSSSADPGYYPQLEWPEHPVTLTHDFYLGIYEITQSQWLTVMGDHPVWSAGVGDDYPVYSVSWAACQEFVQNLSALDGRAFRLPTEAEWEYACRAGTVTRFSFGDGPQFEDAYQLYEEPARYMWWFGNNDPSGAKPVGMKEANPWGLYDMHGNLYEWCSDWWQDPVPRDGQIDPQGPSQGIAHVSKGGHWYGSVLHCRSAFRFNERDADQHGGPFWGFRIVMESSDTSISHWELY